MNAKEYAGVILDELNRTLSAVSIADTQKLADAVLDADCVFVAGAGRSGLAVKGFAMRLMHMGLNAYVVGETTTPNIKKGDLLLVGSGSGETASLTGHAGKAKTLGATLALVTIFPDSGIGRVADVTVKIPAPTPKVAVDTGFRSIQPMGSLFEQSLNLFLDTVILMLMEKKSGDSENMFTRHANLE